MVQWYNEYEYEKKSVGKIAMEQWYNSAMGNEYECEKNIRGKKNNGTMVQ
jgi:hypothetical protein